MHVKMHIFYKPVAIMQVNMHRKGHTCLSCLAPLRSQTSKKASKTTFECKFTVIYAHTKTTIKHDTFETRRPHVGNPRFFALSYGKKHSPSPGGGWLAGWVGGWLVGWLAGLAGLAGWLAGWVGWMAGWLVGWLGWLDGWLAGLAGWVGWPGWLAGWLAGWVGWLAGWLAGWLVGWVWYIGFD